MARGEVTIDELAAQVDMTVRNVRAHQARGLIPPPRIQGRIGYYGAAHRRRLEQIRAMQDEGLNLAAIAKVLNDGQLTQLTTELFRGDAARPVDVEEVLQRLALEPDDPAVARALELGLIEVDGDQVAMGMPGLLAIAEEFLAMGVPLDAQLDALATLQSASAQVAEAYLTLADDHLVARVAVDSGGDVDALRSSIARLRDLAREALTTSFNRTMSDALQAHFEVGGPPGDEPAD